MTSFIKRYLRKIADYSIFSINMKRMYMNEVCSEKSPETAASDERGKLSNSY